MRKLWNKHEVWNKKNSLELKFRDQNQLMSNEGSLLINKSTNQALSGSQANFFPKGSLFCSLVYLLFQCGLSHS